MGGQTLLPRRDGAIKNVDSTVSLTECQKNDEEMKELHDAAEQELVKTVCMWSTHVIVVCAGTSALISYLGGKENYINPLLVSMVQVGAGLFVSHKMQMTVSISFFSYIIIRHALQQGCSASLVPSIYGFFPCAFGFLFRTRRAVVVSTISVLAATFLIFAVDLSDNCTSHPISQSDKSGIIADRLLPLVLLILGNGVVLIVIVKQSQESLLLHARASQSAARLASVRRDVLHRVTHELRTPLNGIVGSVELLTTSETMNEIDMENALTVKNCLQNIVRICDDVLMAAKSNTDDRERKEAVFLLASCVDDVAEVFAASAAAKGINLKVEYNGDITVAVRGMEVELRQVLLNLVGNSIKFTDTGSVTLRVREEPQPQSPSVVTCTFEVQDTGIGIAQEESGMLFDAFYQSEQGAVSRHHRGTGLGLTICRDLVQLMGGTISVDGARGRGARFYFSLELKTEPWAFSRDLGNDFGGKLAHRVVIADSEDESSVSCEQAVISIAPSAIVDRVRSMSALQDLMDKKEVSYHMGTHRIAFLECDSTHPESLVDTILTMKKAGWVVFVYCDNSIFPHVVANLVEANTVFRRPLPLVRLGDAIRSVLKSTPQSTSRPVMSTGDEDSSTNSTKNFAPAAGDRTNEYNRESSKEMDKLTHYSDERKRAQTISLKAGSKVVVVDDTPVNVKVLVKMVSRSTSAPIVSCFDGQSAIDFMATSHREEPLLFLMDWHMPGVCGLKAAESIRILARQRGFPHVYICMLSADTDSLVPEMERCKISYGISISEGTVTEDGTAGALFSLAEGNETIESPVVDIVAEKPVTFKCIQAILTWFQQQVDQPTDESSPS